MPHAIRRPAAVAAFLLAATVAFWWRFAFPTAPAPSKPLPPLTIERGDRIMVFAPHSDDEVLASGGLLSRARRAGAVVRVVLLTNGDGFTLAAEDEFHSVRLTPEKYIQFAYLRQQETLAALNSLGLPSSAVTFLGFPDRGTAAEWENHWRKSNPYTSRYTKLSHSPYHNSYVTGAPFSGAALAEEIMQLIREFNPDTIILPHPNDLHPDHWATHNFVVYSLAMLEESERGLSHLFRQKPQLLTYLVHRGSWPTPKGYCPRLGLAPPPRLLQVGTEWRTFPLTPEEVKAKHQAILEYRSQVKVMRSHLLAFARADELFGLLPPAPEIGPAPVAAVNDPVGDILAGEAEGAADLEEIALWSDRDYLYCRLTVRRPLSPFVAYCLHLHALPALADGTPLRSDLRLRFCEGRWAAFPGRKSAPEPDYPVTASDRAIIVRFPRLAAGPRRRFFVAAEAYLGRLVDRTAWRCVKLAE
ncbi:MAG: PIG-L family deacetylase [Bacillota bacterium]|nr:PIG-L family deacetylase [Bacillota bacterium]